MVRINYIADNKANFQKGLTFPEIMIALVVLAIVVVGALGTFTLSILANIQARDLTRATMHAEYILEHIQSQLNANDVNTLLDDYDGDPYTWIDFAQGESLISATTPVLSEEDIQVSNNTLSAAGSTLFNIEVEVSWQDSRALPGVTQNKSLVCATQIFKE